MRWGWFLLLLGPSVLTLLLLAAIWGLSLGQLEQERQLALSAARQQNETLAYIVAANLEQVLTRPYLYADRAAELLDQGPGAGAALRAALAGDGAYLRLAVLNGVGRVQFASSPLAQGLDRQALPPAGSGLELGRPSGQGEEAWLLPLALALRSPAGREGRLVMLMDLGYFLRLYQGAGLGDRRIGIFQQGGVRLVEADDLSISLGASATGEMEGLLRVSKSLNRFPLAVEISQSQASVFQELDHSRQRHLIWAWSLTLLLLAAGTALTLLALRQRALYRRVLCSETEKEILIQQLETEKGQAYQLASHDHLTGLPNRMLFSELSVSHLSGSRRGRHLHALVFLDLDHFKAVNDQLGHHVGDQLLQTVALRLRAVLRDSDLVSRQGGDEFVLLINELTSAEDAARVAAKIIQAVGAPCQLDGHELVVRPSLGLALAPRDGQDLHTLMAHADAAMYAAKSAGRGTFRFFDGALNGIPVRQDELVRDLLPALEEGGLQLHYQLQHSLDDLQPMGLEALVRWPHLQHGLIYPKDILPLARDLGLLPRLDRWVLGEVCRQLSQWREEGRHLLPIAINLAPETLDDPAFPAAVQEQLARQGLSAAQLGLEIPADWLPGADQGALARLQALAHQGVSLRVDGFGRSQTGFQQLRALPLKWLKVEPSCIGEAEGGKAAGGTAGFIITLAHVQGFRVLVTGVETPEQLVQLKASGADGAQGYHLQRPLPAEEVVALLERRLDIHGRD
ncbi:bifunctional diguanylate cyclase/phosphodiesterase [Azovibrio restrictus]|uniref:putative bifunctional diguanylate cyclase/phosphodiesterase n=1 Tax=Azovibrio restrictus TaxID=146938 RepID=UPI0026F33B49|nr:EAL domain-containing protein [Azovibrio restrictus]MDD3482195.1 EAL domain-containing protein [Azovibrio restrictus]